MTVSLVIGVPTFRRNAQLDALLPMLLEHLAQARADGLVDSGSVLVVDNDPDGRARDMVTAHAARAARDERGLVVYEHETTPGVVAVRNRILDGAARSGARLVAFIDDDETPEENWLVALVRTWREHPAAAVAGRVLPSYPADIDPWIVAGGFFVRRDLPTGTVVPTAPTSNVLVDLEPVRRLGLRFDPSTALTGGEDTVFTAALTAAGERVVFCSEAAVYDEIPPGRATRKWVLTRAFSHGNNTALQRRVGGAGETAGKGARAATLLGGVGRAGVGAARAVWGWARGDAAAHARGARLSARGAGMAAGAAGVVYREYARDGNRLTTTSGRPLRPRVVAARLSRTAGGVVGGPLRSIVSARPPERTPMLALTYDDGPDPQVTPRLLDILASHGAHATFFVLAERAERHPELITRMVTEGHEVALHGPDHRRVTRVPASEALADLERARTRVAELAEKPVRWVRPPYGASSPRLALGMRRLGLTPVLWSATTWDWKDASAAERLAKIDAADAGDIVLSHDGRADVSDGAVEPGDEVVVDVDKPQLLEQALERWFGRGLRVVTVGELVDWGRPRREVRLPR